MTDYRAERRSGTPGATGYRTAFQKDRDRLLYSKAFRRLNGVSQVVSASEGATYHNRMIHSLKVAQVGRRLAESLLAERKELSEILDPDVVESAALAHDMGHPPFGHVAEETLWRLAKEELKLPDGYEGNAQNIRILTKLEVTPYGHGLDLTRATLQAIAKYPLPYAESSKLTDKKKQKKFGYFETESSEWEWIDQPTTAGKQTLECQIMEWADDVSYAIHDLMDFFRVGLIPLDHFGNTGSFEVDRFVESASDDLKIERPDIEAIIDEMLGSIGSLGPYQGFRDQRIALYAFTNRSLNNFLNPDYISVKTGGGRTWLEFDAQIDKNIRVLKHLTKHYVIKSYSLNSIQAGQIKCIEVLLETFKKAMEGKLKDSNRDGMIPNLFKDKLDEEKSDESRNRLVVDMVAGLTDQQALELFHRFSGIHPGSIRNPII